MIIYVETYLVSTISNPDREKFPRSPNTRTLSASSKGRISKYKKRIKGTVRVISSEKMTMTD